MDMGVLLTILMFISLMIFIMSGYPVAFTLGGTALLFGLIGAGLDAIDFRDVELLPNRIYENIIRNELLFAIPLFISMGCILEKSKIAEDLLENMGLLFGKLRGGLGISVTLVGALLAASTGIVGATVVTMGLMSLPTMLRQGYDTRLATGSIAAAGTLGQIIPPSIVLILLADVMSNAWQQAQSSMGIFSPTPLSAGQLFAGALLPGLLLVGLYILYQIAMAIFKPETSPALAESESRLTFKELGLLFKALLPPLVLIFAVLGSILKGIATPTEAAAVGAVGAMILAVFRSRGKGFWPRYSTIIRDSMQNTVRVSSMIYAILIGAALFSLVFRGFGGDDAIEGFLSNLPGGYWTAILLVMVVMFILGFFLDFIELTFVVVPIVAPVLLAMDGSLGPIWLGILIAMNLQTSFLTPPFGFALFYLRGVAPDSVQTRDIYRGALPFVAIQIIALVILALWPALATWLPAVIF